MEWYREGKAYWKYFPTGKHYAWTEHTNNDVYLYVRRAQDRKKDWLLVNLNSRERYHAMQASFVACRTIRLEFEVFDGFARHYWCKYLEDPVDMLVERIERKHPLAPIESQWAHLEMQ